MQGDARGTRTDSGGGPIAAIFDLDDTLLSESTGRSIFRYLRESGDARGWIRRWDLLTVLGSTLLYHYGALDVTRVMGVTARTVRGVPVADMWAMVERWFAERVVKSVAPGGLAALAWHRAQGHMVVMCTASSQFSALPVARHLGIEHVVYTPWKDDGERMTGEVQLPLAYGTGKVYWMRQWAEANGVRLRDCYFYSDHPSDLPLLESVAHPTAVNPYPGLARVAAARDWPIVKWY